MYCFFQSTDCKGESTVFVCQGSFKSPRPSPACSHEANRELHPGHTPPLPPPPTSLHLQGKHTQGSPATRTFPCKPNKIDGRNCGKEAGREAVVSKVGSEAWASSSTPSNNNTKEKQTELEGERGRGKSRIGREGRTSLTHLLTSSQDMFESRTSMSCTKQCFRPG